ncbi:MAG TPA: histidine utilization repressor [Azospirillaceae bacterium]|nr:histidine utilization repressor [Azospirillaceae bacterium]
MSATLNQRIRTDIENKILSGEWAPGHRIPFEIELAEQYGCSRMTVNKVLSALADTGLIERYRRAGSFVARPRTQSAVLHIPDIRAEVEARGDRYRYELVARNLRPASAEDIAKLAPTCVNPGGNRTTGRVLALHCRHFAGDEPLAVEERLINLGAVPDAADQDFSATPPGTWLLGHVPWTEAEHQILARNAGPHAALLVVRPETACLVVERRTWRTGETVTFVRLTYPGHMYRLVAQFTPAPG